ncbi:hypothetical protein ACROYT_G015125 [Oculina patagonica]
MMTTLAATVEEDGYPELQNTAVIPLWPFKASNIPTIQKISQFLGREALLGCSRCLLRGKRECDDCGKQTGRMSYFIKMKRLTSRSNVTIKNREKEWLKANKQNRSPRNCQEEWGAIFRISKTALLQPAKNSCRLQRSSAGLKHKKGGEEPFLRPGGEELSLRPSSKAVQEAMASLQAAGTVLCHDKVLAVNSANNQQLKSSFKDLLQDTVSQIKRSFENAADLQMKELKKLKFSEPRTFKCKANEYQYKFNLKLVETQRRQVFRS